MSLPIRFLLFWYPQTLSFFIRLWKNLMAYLEEDLAVGLMIRLLFVPLFHDDSIFGHIISFFFRLFRIGIGFFAFAAATFVFILIALLWFFDPLFILVSLFKEKDLLLPALAIFLFGVSLFIHMLSVHRPKKVSHIRNTSEIWLASTIDKKNINWNFLLKEVEVRNFIQSLEIPIEDLANVQPQIQPNWLDEVLPLAQKSNAIYITPVYFFVALFITGVTDFETILLKFNLNKLDLENAVSFMELKRNQWRRIMIWDEDFGVRHLKGTNRGWLSAPTPHLDAITIDLTKSAARYSVPDFAGREKTVEEVVSILSQSSETNVLLIGAPGSGKTTLVQNLAAKIIAGDAPGALATKRIVQLDFTSLMSNISSEGDLAQRIQAAFEEAAFIQDVIIYVDDIQNLGLGEAGSSFNLFSLLLPYLESNRLQFIASTEPEYLGKTLEKYGGFIRIFHKVEVPPASIEETINFLEKQAIDLARYSQIKLTFVAMKTLANLSQKFIHDRVLPDSALGLLKECEVIGRGGLISSHLVKQVIQERIKVPVVELDESHKKTLLNLEDIIHQKMIDQQEAVKAVADSLRRASTALREGNRPIGSFLFVGPTGVGKTELAKILAEVYFSNKDAFVSFDMSEYQSADSVYRLIGNSENPGELTEIIKRKPYALILLDEFEKANPQILMLFLQVLEEGRLTDSSGKHIDFTNTIIIATSNAASVTIAKGLESGQKVEQISDQVREELLKLYKPELVNRFDEVVIFKPLSQKDLEQIVILKLKSLQDQLKKEGYLIEFDLEMISEIARRAFDPALGARPMRRFIQDTLEANLSKLILSNQITKGKVFKSSTSLLQQ